MTPNSTPHDPEVIGLLLSFSEWMDVNGMYRPPKAKRTKNDVAALTSHADIVDAFLEGKGKRPL